MPNPQTATMQQATTVAEPKPASTAASWVEVSASALRHNFRVIQEHIRSKVIVCPVIKSDAYGHGATAAASALSEAGAKWFAVSTADEGQVLRRRGIEARILVLSGFCPGEEQEIVRHRLTPTVWDCGHIESLEKAAARAGQRVAVHLKINTGMNRLGADPKDLPLIYDALRVSPHVCLEGIFSHFSASEVVDHPLGEEQLRQYVDAVAGAKEHGFAPTVCHMANSAAIVSRPSSWFDLVRPGLAIFGYCLPLESRRRGAADPLPVLALQPALTWKTRVLQVRDVTAGQQVGYSGGHVTTSGTKVAVLAVGYGDGLSRKLSSRGRMIIRDAYAPILGNVSMNLTAVDVTNIPGVAAGDETTIIGNTPSCRISVMEHAHIAATIPYDILCNISGRLPRKYVE